MENYEIENYCIIEVYEGNVHLVLDFYEDYDDMLNEGEVNAECYSMDYTTKQDDPRLATLEGFGDIWDDLRGYNYDIDFVVDKYEYAKDCLCSHPFVTCDMIPTLKDGIYTVKCIP